MILILYGCDIVYFSCVIGPYLHHFGRPKELIGVEVEAAEAVRRDPAGST